MSVFEDECELVLLKMGSLNDLIQKFYYLDSVYLEKCCVYIETKLQQNTQVKKEMRGASWIYVHETSAEQNCGLMVSGIENPGKLYE